MPDNVSALVCTLPGITCFSLAHAPKSISLQRSLQKGRQSELAFHSTGRLQVGQGKDIWLLATGHWPELGIFRVFSLSGQKPVASGRLACFSRARRQQKWHVLTCLRRTHVDVGPSEESNCAAMMAAADFRKQFATGGQSDAKQLTGDVFVEHELKQAAAGRFTSRPRVLPREP